MNGTKIRSLRVLVVGGTGQLGLKIVRELVALGRADVRVTHREGAKGDAMDALRKTGAELVVADLADASALAKACHGVDMVVSAVQGLRDIVVDGQTRLLRAAEEAGVARMMPSDYSVDFFRTEEGGNRNLDLRREFDRVLDASKVRGTSLLCGALMDLLAYGAIGPDPKTGIFRVWGDFDQPADFTFTDDVAKYVAAIAVDTEAPRIVRVAGDTKSAREIAGIFQEVRGMPVTLESAGTLEALDQLIDKLRKDDPAPTDALPMWQRLQYTRDMQSGRGKLSPLDNARYPAVHPIDVRTLLSRAYRR